MNLSHFKYSIFKKSEKKQEEKARASALKKAREEEKRKEKEQKKQAEQVKASEEEERKAKILQEQTQEEKVMTTPMMDKTIDEAILPTSPQISVASFKTHTESEPMQVETNNKKDKAALKEEKRQAKSLLRSLSQSLIKTPSSEEKASVSKTIDDPHPSKKLIRQDSKKSLLRQNSVASFFKKRTSQNDLKVSSPPMPILSSSESESMQEESSTRKRSKLERTYSQRELVLLINGTRIQFKNQQIKKEFESLMDNSSFKELMRDIIHYKATMEGLGNPEKLKHGEYKGKYSRRIDEATRLIYKIHSNGSLIIYDCKGYHK